MGPPAPNQKTSVAGKLVSGVLFIGVPVFGFWSLAALLVSQGVSRWIAGPIGGALLLLPLLWHAFGERKRKRAEKPAKGLLSGRDRLGLRVLLVVGVVLAVMFGLMRDKTVSALKSYADWPLHGTSPSAGAASSNVSDLLALVHGNKAAIIDVRAGGPAWKQWLNRKLPKPLRALDYHTIIWTREIAAVVSDTNLVQQLERQAKAGGHSLPVRGNGRFWSRRRSKAAYVSATTMVWGSDVDWVERVADGKNRASKHPLAQAAARVKPGAMFVLLDRSGTWLGIPGIHDTAIAVYRAGGKIRVEASARYVNDPPMVHVALNIRALVARAFGMGDRYGLTREKVEGLTIRREGNTVHAELVRPAADIEKLIDRARRTGDVEPRR